MTQATLKGKQVFITGGAGFIGSTLIGRLIEDNKVTIYDNFKRDSLSNKAYVSHPNLQIVKGDILDYPKLRNAMEGAQYVVHCAAIAGIDTVIKKPTETMPHQHDWHSQHSGGCERFARP
jgi:UDP-glucose 4-epimerase